MEQQSQYSENKQQGAKEIIIKYYKEQRQIIINKDQVTIIPLFSLTNDVYSVQTQHQSLLLKIYQPNLEEFTDNLLETLVVCRLAQRGLYPSVLYFNPQLRIQSFIHSNIVQQSSITKESLLSIIQKLADFSCQQRSFVKGYNLDNDIPNKYGLNNLLQIFKKIYQKKKYQCPQLIQQSKEDLQSIFHNKYIIQKLGQILAVTPLVLSHNDCHLGNVLFSSVGQFIVDYQFCQFNFIGYDLGNFLNQWATQYSHIFQIREEDQMKESLIHQIVNIYFSKINQTYNCSPNMTTWLYYTKIGRVLSHFFWMIIGLKQINHSKISFSMVYYIKRRKEEFLKHFTQLLAIKK